MGTKSTRAPTAKAFDAIALLTADHKTVKALFADYEKLPDNDDERKETLVQRLCDELTVHATVEEEIFYPAVRDAIDDSDLLDEALVEHATVKSLIAQLREMLPDDDLYDAKVKVLSEYVAHHVKEEEGEMFPKTRKADIALQSLGDEMAARKEELKTEWGMLRDTSPVPRAKRSNGSKRPAK